jgi:MoaA/NifB/PqqE/SkfB family radical SAM enzyme
MSGGNASHAASPTGGVDGEKMGLDTYLRILAGVASGDRAFTGPYLVQLDLTNSCNTRCLYCMNYSALGLKEEHPPGWGGTFLDMDIVRRIIPELRSAGVREVDVTGNGEPFMHPDAVEVIRLVKANGMRCVVRTNGLLIDRDLVDTLLGVGLDGIDLSLWAGSPEGYVEVHPGETADSFLKIKDWLGYIAEKRGCPEWGRRRFKVKILDVIAHPNYRRIEEMLSFACEVKADYVMFKYLLEEFFNDAALEMLSLREAEKGEIRGLWAKSTHKRGVRNNLGNFVRAMSQPFPVSRCFFGWLYARLTVTGDVLPCCGCLGLSMGNINERGFRDIWFGERYGEFRRRSRNLGKDPYFSGCSCSRMCPHYLPVMPAWDVWSMLR